MITHIQGRLVEKTPAYVVIDCSGVGYLLHITLNTFSKLGSGENCKLYTHLAIREDAHTLYGFHDQLERQIFRLLISVSGVGANTARMILSSLNPKEVQEAVLNEDTTLLKSIKGIGSKSAQRIIVDLKDKIAKEFGGVEISTLPSNRNKEEALSALEVLGFSRNATEKVVSSLLRESPELPIEELIKTALKSL